MADIIQVVVPTYRRLDALQSTYDQLKDLPGIDLIFVAHERDDASRLKLAHLGVKYVIDTQPPSGVNATNCGYWGVSTKWFVIGQDDFRWHEGWLDEALRVQQETYALVVGFNDGYEGNRPEHSVGWLINRPFVENNSLSIGFPNVIFNPHYKKNFSDNELCETARHRGVYAYAPKALLEHLHPSFGKSQSDATYEVLDKRFEEDFALYNSRKHLWSK